jgi:NAD(P)-dependent dehydrogenase (short-subunit alcohol dehydrogenase family)
MRTWFITGASRGLGALIAQEALAAGDAVVATARNSQTVIDVFGDHPNLLAAALDVTDEAQAHKAVAAAMTRFGRIDVLVNNAGFGLLGAVEEATGEEVERVYRTNVFGLLSTTRAVLPHMRARRAGHVINMSSVGGYRAGAGFGIYSSTKFAVEALSEALAAELNPIGVKVTVVEPGYFRTDFLDASSLTVSPIRIADYDATAGAVRRRAAEVSHAQPGDPAKLAKALISVVNAPKPPFRMAFGSDTVAAIEAKNAGVAAELAQWRDLSISTDFPSGE